MTKKLIIDGTAIEVADSTTLMHACEQVGSEIPRFCYHERLSIAGNCRMCLVEVQGSPKPIASCAMLVSDLPPNRDGSPKIVSTNSAACQKSPRRRDGIPADQSPARLPDLRSGRRVRSARPSDGVRHRRHALSRKQARGRRKAHRPADQDDDDALHPLHALRSLHDGSRGRRGTGSDLARRRCRDHHLSRKRHHVGDERQRGRSLSGRRADASAVGVQCAAVGNGQVRNRSMRWTPLGRPSASIRAEVLSCAFCRATTTP